MKLKDKIIFAFLYIIMIAIFTITLIDEHKYATIQKDELTIVTEVFSESKNIKGDYKIICDSGKEYLLAYIIADDEHIEGIKPGDELILSIDKNRIKEKFTRKLENATNIDENTKYELLQRLQGMKNHNKLCHGDFHPSNVIVTEDESIYVIDWAHVTQGNASADAARTYLLFSIDKKEALAEKYLNLFAEKSGIEKTHIRRWIPIVAATQLTKGIKEEQEFLSSWINVVDFG